MIKKYKAKFLDYFQTNTLSTKVHIAVFEVHIGPANSHDILFFKAHEAEGYDIGNNEFFRFCYQLAVMADSKKVNFKRLRNKKCLVEITDSMIIGVYPRTIEIEGGQNAK